VGNFREAQSGGIGSHEDGPKLELLDRFEKPYDFSLAQDDWQFPGLARERDMGDGPIAAEGVAIEKSEGADRLVKVTPGDVTLLNQIYLILTNLFRPQQFGRLAEMPGEVGDAGDVGVNGAQRPVAQSQVVGHALTKSSHGKLLSKRECWFGDKHYLCQRSFFTYPFDSAGDQPGLYLLDVRRPVGADQRAVC